MLAQQRRHLPSGPQWVHEIKHDGFRFVCRREGNRVRVFCRNGNDYTDRVPRIAQALRALPAKSATLDGEGVICDNEGISSFDQLRAAMASGGSREAFLYAFDLLEFNGRDLRDLSWDARRNALIALLRNGLTIRTCRGLRRRHRVPERLPHRPGRHRRQAPRPALSIWTLD